MPVSVFGAHWFVWCPSACSVQIGMFCAVGEFGAGLGCVSDSGAGVLLEQRAGWARSSRGTRPSLPRGLFAHNMWHITELSPAQGRRPEHRPGIGACSPASSSASSSFSSSMSIVPSEVTQEVPLIHFLISRREDFAVKGPQSARGP